MRAFVLASAVFGLLLLGVSGVRAQGYPFSPLTDFHYQQYLQYQADLEWQQYLRYLQEIDPYYDLHVMHYQLYRQRYHTYGAYLPCCYSVGIPVWSTPAVRAPHAVRNAPRPVVRRR
jgi:hypothetical protein